MLKAYRLKLYFVLPSYYWVWGLPCIMVGITNGTPLEKIVFPFSSMYQLQIAPWLVVGLCIHFSLGLNFHLVWTFVYLVHTIAISGSSYMHQLCESVSFKSSTTSGSYNHSASSLAEIYELWGEGLNIHTPFTTEGFKVHHSAYCQLWFSVLISIY